MITHLVSRGINDEVCAKRNLHSAVWVLLICSHVFLPDAGMERIFKRGRVGGGEDGAEGQDLGVVGIVHGEVGGVNMF